MGDNHKNGDEKLDPCRLIRKLRQQRFKFTFSIKNITDKMIRVLRPSYDRGGTKLTQHELGDDPKLFLDKTMSSISQSVSVTVDSSRLLSLRGKRNKKTMQSALAALPEDGADEAPTPAASAPEATIGPVEPPAWNDSGWGDIEIVDVYTAALGARKPHQEDIKVRVYKRAFSRGATRAAFFVRIETTGEVRVLKEGIYEGTRLNSRQTVFGDLDSQEVAAKMANEFNEVSARKGVPGISYQVVPAVVFCFKGREQSRRWTVVESYLRGRYRKLNSNGGWLDVSDCAKMAQTFSHFTWHQSAGECLVCDLQGVVNDPDGRCVSLTDPQIHDRTNARFGTGNLGKDGMARFFATHVCSEHCGRSGFGCLAKL